MNLSTKNELRKFALQIRIGIVEQIKARGVGHMGGSLSIADTLAVLYGAIMKIDPRNPKWEERDKLVCSKGHAGPAVYAALGLKGYFPYDEIKTLNQPGTNFPSHCDRLKTPGVDMTTGSLGQGASLAVGMALSDHLKNRGSRTFLILGDGEIAEGQVWEAAMFAGGKKLNNMVWLVDQNGKQLDGYTWEVLNTLDLEKKFEAFGFEAVTILGHDIESLYQTLQMKKTDKPIAIILNTIKGKGIAEVEEMKSNHNISPTSDDCDRWIADLQKELQKLDKGGAA